MPAALPSIAPKKVGMISLGCAKNLVDAEIMLGSARAQGMEITADAESLGCLNEVKHCRAIVDAGTSADAQIAVFKEQTGSPDVALRAVTDWLAQATLQ